MSVTSDLLFSYLRGILYPTSKIKLDLGNLEQDYVLLAQGLMYLEQCMTQYREFADALCSGDLNVKPPPAENEIAAPLKSLQANLRHLTWQSQQVAKGDYKQHVDYMGDFAAAFNTMVEQLSDRQIKLENEIDASRKHAQAMEQSNLLLSELTRHIPEQIFVVSLDKHDILHTNNLAQYELNADPFYIENLIKLIPEDIIHNSSEFFEIKLTYGNAERYLEVNTYLIEWYGEKSVVLIIHDISVERKQLLELEGVAYRDSLTQSYNRFYGLLTLNEWLDKKKRFSLIFVDLDNLKYVNDKHGHHEGDVYITKIAGYLQSYSQDTIVCRLGGDEYMLLVPDEEFDNASRRMDEIQHAIQNDEYLLGKDYYYSVSFGIVAVDENDEYLSSDILSIADERMYEHKRARKKERQSSG